jgi:diaminopimelate decarboxylase
MNASSLTGSRRSQFGFELGSAEAEAAIEGAARAPHLRLRGVMSHIGSGIRDTRAFGRAVERLIEAQAALRRVGAEPDLIDLGGGLGTRLSREFTTVEMVAYLGFGRLPALPKPAPDDLVRRYARAVGEAIESSCRRRGVPTLVLEPGRVVVSDAQVLLLRVGAVRERAGLGRFALTDGGALTVSMMFLSELHVVLLANREAPTDAVPTSVFGRLPSPLDVVYRNIRLPRLQPGDLLAVMDAGAYFTSTATNFGGPRPAVALVDDGRVRLVRRRETSEDLVRADLDLDGREAGNDP